MAETGKLASVDTQQAVCGQWRNVGNALGGQRKSIPAPLRQEVLQESFQREYPGSGFTHASGDWALGMVEESTLGKGKQHL